MKDYLEKHEWCIIEEGFHPEFNRISESIFSLGNGKMGQRGIFEEHYSGDSLLGHYIAGVYFPDRTRVGWWKIGYPESFAKVLNSTNWTGIDVHVDKHHLDLNQCRIDNFVRILNMKDGYLQRSFTAILPDGKKVKVFAQRFISIVDDESALIQYRIQPLNFDGEITFTPFIDGDVINEDANFNEKFWKETNREIGEAETFLKLKTINNTFHTCTGMKYEVFKNDRQLKPQAKNIEKLKCVGKKFKVNCKQDQEIILYKYVANLSTMYHKEEDLMQDTKWVLGKMLHKGYDTMLEEHAAAWHRKWKLSDIEIKGDVSAQQAIRFNIFQMNQTYTGEDPRLNIGPKGFTGEKYGGSTYWDTEAYALYFYLSTSPQEVAKNLLLYRYRHLDKAIENAEKLGFKDGAALYPMVTMNGEESHNEWEITFEEIHRNGAMAYAIFNYINYTGDRDYLIDYGLEVLIAISRFWVQRVHFSEPKQQYVMHGVTGPNEYENNINNNWYTNLIAQWTLKYCMESLVFVKEKAPEKYEDLVKKTNFREEETKHWQKIIDLIYLPEDEEQGIFLQQEGYLDKELRSVKDIPKDELPINQNWSWDRILRSCFIKQADVLQGLFFFEDDFDKDTIKRNFDYYEPKTVHESSLSPCVHAILAAYLGYRHKAYNFYLQTARLDLDDYNNDTEDGCHITSMAGTWMSLVYGFGGMHIENGELHFKPFIPDPWDYFSFKIFYRNSLLKIEVDKSYISVRNESDKSVQVFISDQEYEIQPGNEVNTNIIENGID